VIENSIGGIGSVYERDYDRHGAAVGTLEWFDLDREAYR
jgi:hypothetical protein